MSGRGAGDSEKPKVIDHPSLAADVATGEEECSPPESHNRRSAERIDVTWSVDCETEDTFLYAAITNISEMGIFVRTTEPLAIGTRVTLRFASPHTVEPFILAGVVQWVNAVRPHHDNPNPGMGIRFATLTLDDRERIVEAIRTIAYLREDPQKRN